MSASRMRWTMLVLVMLLITATGCSSGGSNEESTEKSSSTKASGSSAPSSAGPSDLAALKKLAKKRFGKQDWWKRIVSVEQASALGAQVIVVRTDIRNDDPTGYEAASEISSAFQDLEPSFAHNIEVFGLMNIDGKDRPTSMGMSGSGGLMMTDAFDLPPAPQSADELLPWLKKVYGKGGIIELGPDETWLASITSIKMEASPAEDGTRALVIRTTIPDSDRDAPIQQLNLVGKAVIASGCPLAQEFWWYGANGYGGLTSSGVAPAQGQGSPLYPE